MPVRKEALAMSGTLSGDSADLPWTATGPQGVAIPDWATKCLIKAKMLTGGGASTVPVAIYGKDKYDNSSREAAPSASVANVDSETDDIWLASLDDLQNYTALAPYINGSAGAFTLTMTAYFEG